MTTIILGPTTPGPNSDNGNGGLLCATKYSLTQAAVLQTLSFYVQTASGQLNLGVYADTNGAPGALVAETGAFTPIKGWNPKPTKTTPTLQPGTYWLAYLPQNDGLGFMKTPSGGTSRTHGTGFGALPAPFPPAPLGQSTSIWSLNATLESVVVTQPPQTTAINITVPSASQASVAVTGLIGAKLTVTATEYDAAGRVLATQTASNTPVTPPIEPPVEPPIEPPIEPPVQPPSTGVTLQAIDGEALS